MAKFKVGDIVLVPFPFSDLKGQKLRPAMVIASSEYNNLILCQITSKPYSSKTTIKLTKGEFLIGGLPVTSYIRPDKIFTAEESLILRTSGELNKKKINLVLKTVREIFK